MLIAPGLYSLDQTKGGRVHAYLVETNEGLTLVDTLYNDDASVILDELQRIGKSPADVKRILLTHGHKSHLGGLATIAELSGAPVFAHEWEIPIIEGMRKADPVGNRFPKPAKLSHLPRSLEVYTLQLALNRGIGSHTAQRVSGRLKDGDRIGPFEVLSVPGHTPGSIALWWSEGRVLIAGDSVATWPQLDIGWPTFNLDSKAAVRSIGKMAELSQVRIVCCGHGDPITSGAHDALLMLLNGRAN